MHIELLGAVDEVTGSCYLITIGRSKVLLECGLIQGGYQAEKRNYDDFSFNPETIDAVVLSHSHIDHSGRLPLLVKRGYRGSIYTHKATKDLCRIMLKDSGFINEKEAEWENKKRLRKGLKVISPLYTMQEASESISQFVGLNYKQKKQIIPGLTICFQDAGHILGSAIVEIFLEENGIEKKVVFSGDLGHSGAPILKDPECIKEADLVLMESTYGDRLHRSTEETFTEFENILNNSHSLKGNILIPSFAVGRTQELLYLFSKYFDQWGMSRWQIFLDSPLAIEATSIYSKHSALYDDEASQLFYKNKRTPLLPNLHISRTANQSMAINRITSGAIIIAGSGMCNGGRIKHHLKYNAWRKECQVVIVGFQAKGTPGRALVDGAKHIRLWGETIRVQAKVHTLGGLSAHADQQELCNWYSQFTNHPPVQLVHGESDAMSTLDSTLSNDYQAKILAFKKQDKINILTI